MAITVLNPIMPRNEVAFSISYEDACLIMEIRNKVGLIQAIRVLRMYNKECGIAQAKKFVENLDF